MSHRFKKPSTTFTFSFYCVIIALYLGLGRGLHQNYGTLGLASCQLALLVLCPLIYTLLFKGPWKKIFPLKIPQYQELLWVLILTSLVILGLETLLYYQSEFFTFAQSEISNQVNSKQGSSWKKILENIFLFAGLSALTEEFFFRGFIQYSFVKRWGAALGILGSSFSFAIAHFNLDFFISYLLLGAFLGIVRHKTNNLSLCIFTHFSYNLYGLLA